ncbi:hypothetical protein YC2023_119320 [Brassica napus]
MPPRMVTMPSCCFFNEEEKPRLLLKPQAIISNRIRTSLNTLPWLSCTINNNDNVNNH